MQQILGNLSLLLEFPVINVKIIVDGLMIGSLFALAAYGLALVWGVMNVKNLAQGDFVIAGGYIAWALAGAGLPPLLGVPAAFGVMWLLGWVVYKVVISRVIERDLFTSLLATFGLAIMIAQILNLLFGSDTQSIQLKYDTLYFLDGFVDVPIAKLIGVLLVAILATSVVLFMKSSRMGQAIRATAQDARAARVLGIDTEKVYALHLLAERRHLRRHRCHHRYGVVDPAVLRHLLFDPCLRGGHRRRPRQPARRHRRRPRHRRARAIRRAHLRHRLSAGGRGIATVTCAARAINSTAPHAPKFAVGTLYRRFS